MVNSFRHRKPTREFNLILVGSCGVGKTTFVKRYLTGEFEIEKEYAATSRVFLPPLTMHTNRGTIQFNVLDIPGNAGFDVLPNIYDYWKGCENTSCAIIMFDVTCKTSHDSAREWYNHLTTPTFLRKKIPIVLCGNKVETKNYPKIKENQITFREDKNLQYYDISVKSNINVEMPFLWLARTLIDDDQLKYVEPPALMPPEFELDDATRQKYEQELKKAATENLPDDDDN